MRTFLGPKMVVAISIILCLMLGLSGCKVKQEDAAPPVPSVDVPSVETVIPPSSEEDADAPTESLWQLDESQLTDESLLSIVMPMEIALLRDNAFVFSDPNELNETQLYLAFLILTDYSELEKYQSKEDQLFYFKSDVIISHLISPKV